MKKTGKKLTAILLAAAMAVALMPSLGVQTVYAEEDYAAMSVEAGISAIEPGTRIWFGNVDQEEGETVQDTKWRVLETSEDRAMLISEELLDVIQYDTERGRDWNSSTSRDWCLNYYQNWKGTLIEKDAIALTSKHDDVYQTGEQEIFRKLDITNEHFFLLSAEEADTLFESNADRLAYYSNGESDYWWLRSDRPDRDDLAAFVWEGGAINNYFRHWYYGARPAFNLDLTQVLMTSSPEGKITDSLGQFTEIMPAESNERKLTLYDDERDFTVSLPENAELTAEVNYSSWSIPIGYSGAGDGENEYVSAILFGSDGEALFYGSFAQDSASGTASIALPAGLDVGSYELDLFSEQKNGVHASDYASAFTAVDLEVVEEIPVAFEAVSVAAGASVIEPGIRIWFGNVEQEEGETEPDTKWRILETSEDRAMLISEELLALMPFDDGDLDRSWNSCTARDWCLDYFDNWKGSLIEKSAIALTSKHDGVYQTGEHEIFGEQDITNEHFFFLSAEEADTLFKNNADRIAYGNWDGESYFWWLRSDRPDWQALAAFVWEGGSINNLWKSNSYGARPAFNLDLTPVLLTSSPEGKITGITGEFTAIEVVNSNERKLTLYDAERDFTVSLPADAKLTEGKNYSSWSIPIGYSGAGEGENEYVSAILRGSDGEALYYGSFAQGSESGTASIAIPAGLDIGSYELDLFSEQKNGVHASDYASAFTAVELEVVEDTPPVIDPSTLKMEFPDDRNVMASGDKATISLKVTDNGEITQVRVIYKGPGNWYRWFDLEPVGDDIWSGEFEVVSTTPPGQWKIRYFDAYDNAGNVSEVFNSNIVDYEDVLADLSEGDFTISTRYNLSFDENGGMGEMEPIPAFEGDELEVPGCAFTAPENKVFWGWNTVDVGTQGNYGTWYYPGDKITLGEDLTLYARWSDPALSICSYDMTQEKSSSGGKFTDLFGWGDPSYGCNNYTVMMGDEYSVTAIPDEWYEFVGWYNGKYIHEDEQGNPIQDAKPYLNEENLITTDLTCSFTVSGSMVLCPVFKEADPISIQNAKVVLSGTSFTYDGKVHKPTVKTIGGMTLDPATDYTLKIRDSKGATVSSPKEPDTYTITITGKGHYTGTTTATYKIIALTPTGITLKPAEADLATGATLQLQATVTPAGADPAVTWKSSNTGIATVDSSGKVKAKKYGKVTITATTVNGKKATSTIQTRFSDVNNPRKTYYVPVYWAVDNGITKSTVTFKPDNTVTRGEFVAFIWRMAGQPSSGAKLNFKDVNESTQFYAAIRWAVGKGIIKGYSDKTFRGDVGVTRGEAATMLWRFAGKPEPKTKKSPFSDLMESGADSYKAILWGYENKIINGSGGMFLKNDGCTRGNIVTFLHRYNKIVPTV